MHRSGDWRRIQTVGIRCAAGGRINIRRTHHEETTAIGRDGRIGALVEQNRVVLDVTVVAEADVRDTAAVTGAQIAAHPVVVELVEVRAIADGDATGPRRGRREQLITGRGVPRNRIVMQVHVAIEAVLQLSVRRQAELGLARARIRVDATHRVRAGKLTLADVDTAGAFRRCSSRGCWRRMSCAQRE